MPKYRYPMLCFPDMLDRKVNLRAFRILRIYSRRDVFRLFTGQHKLEAEVGRWFKTSPGERFCKYCLRNHIEVVEDEAHVTDNCPPLGLPR